MSNSKPDTDIELLKPPVPMGSPPDPYDSERSGRLGSNEKAQAEKTTEAQNKAVDRIKAIAEKHQSNFVAKTQTQDQNKGKTI